ncbi:MAG: HDIG domain-containing protein [Bacteroidetes bacterium]|nr:HDIG domain-containing protein [Bacteroidota bacterium]
MLKKLVAFFHFLRNKHAFIYKFFLFSFAVFIITYSLPKEARFRYELANINGKPWQYENLIAPFDFSIKKNTQQLADEQADVKKLVKPFFLYNSKIKQRILDQFRDSIDEHWIDSELYKSNDAKSIIELEVLSKGGSVKYNTYKLGVAIIDTLYSYGIIESTEAIQNKGSDFEVLLDRDGVVEERELGVFYTFDKAEDFIVQTALKSSNVDAQLLSRMVGNILIQNITYDEKRTNELRDKLLNEISPKYDLVQKNQSIVNKGDIVDAKKIQILESLKIEFEQQVGGQAGYLAVLLGQLVIVISSISILLIFLALFRKDIFEDNAKIAFLLLLISSIAVCTSLVTEGNKISIYMLPFCIVPVIIRAFYDTRVALFTHLVTILIMCLFATSQFEYLFLQLIAGIISIFSIVNMRSRSQIFIAAAFIFAAYALAYIALKLIHEATFISLQMSDFTRFGVSALLTLLSYPLIFIFEKLFGFTSDVSLMELTDTNHPLLRELSMKAPGTFQHSLQVANLAEEIIYAIGGNALLVRVGALYHDVGKTDMPLFFIENQATGVNPHEDLSHDESADIIISHVVKGVEKAKKYKLPDQIIDFIRTHHGTTFTWYFYRNFKELNPETEVDQTKFQYPGPIPFSKETAVLMMTDSVEAASRSLKTYDAESISNLVETVLNRQIEQNQFMNANITFRDITQIKKIFKKRLMNMYHVRVEYPR